MLLINYQNSAFVGLLYLQKDKCLHFSSSVCDNTNFTKICLKPPVDNLCSIYRREYKPIDLLILRLFTSTIGVKGVVEYLLITIKSGKCIPFCTQNTHSWQIRFLLLIWLFLLSRSFIFFWFYFVSLYVWLYVLYASV
jgi:hypothetical protein